MNSFSPVVAILKKLGMSGPLRRTLSAVSTPLKRLIPPPLAVLLYTGAGVALFFPYAPTTHLFDLPREGDIAKETIIAPFTYDIVKTPEELVKERHDASLRVLLTLDFDPDAARQARRRLGDLHTVVYALSASPPSDTVGGQLTALLGRQMSSATIRTLRTSPAIIDNALTEAQRLTERGICSALIVPSNEKRNAIQTRVNTTFDDVVLYEKDFVTLRKAGSEATVAVSDIPVREEALEAIIKKQRNALHNDAAALGALYEVFSAAIQPAVSVNQAETSRRMEKAASEILPAKGKVIKETEIVRKHQVVTEDIVERLYSLRMSQEQIERKGGRLRLQATNIGKLLLLLLTLVFLAGYMRRYHPKVSKETRYAFAIATLVLFQAFIIRAGLLLAPRLFETASDSGPLTLEYIIPTSVGAMLAMILFGFRVSFIVSLFTAVLFGIGLGFNFQMFLLSLLTSIMAGYSTKKIRYRWDFMKAIPPVFLVYAVMILIIEAVGYHFSVVGIMQNWGLAIVNCIVSTFLVMMSAIVFENLFDIATDMTLIELSDMNNPVLKRLSIEAAGTYNHSVLVGNLAESAAEKVGANSLLSRVASYYHDIGKIEKADYFIENASPNDKSRHTRLAPTMSALIISSHVKDGVELARVSKLPRVIRDAILQHHGTSTVSFFYEKARAQDPHNQVQEESFRYPGPVPQTRENAIIMLADAVEAASRSLGTSSPKLLRELVRKIIRDKFMSAQLDQCDLTLKDLDLIVDGFMPILQGIFHSRDPNK
jgi:putative nucleotidyltransferase with HDIG domain